MAVGLTLLLGAITIAGGDSTRLRAADSTRASAPKPAPAVSVAPSAPPGPAVMARPDEITEMRQMLAAQLAGRAVAAARSERTFAGPRLATNVRRAASLPATRGNRLLAESPMVAALVPPPPAFRRLIGGRLIADSIVIEKRQRRMTLYYRGDSVAVYLVALGKNPIGDKLERGDDRTPEGVYYIDARNESSEFHRSLHVSYPSPEDRARATERGVDPGGDIMIHGLPAQYAMAGDEHRFYDWTKGCIALTNAEIEEVFAAVQLGAVIEIRA